MPPTIDELLLALGIEPASNIANVLRPEVMTLEGEIFAEGEAAGHLYVFCDDDSGESGMVEFYLNREGSDKPATLERNIDGVFGEIEFVARDETGATPTRLFSARTLGAVRAVRVAYRSLLALDPDVLQQIDRRLAATAVGRLRAQVMAADAGRASNKALVLAETILALVEDSGVSEAAGRRLRLHKTQQALADEVGLTREVVNGHINEWVRAGLLSVEQGALAILDLDRLRRFIEMQRKRTRATHDRVTRRVDAALAQGDNFRARNLALDALRYLPASVELQHRAALSALRCGATGEAERLLAHFGFGLDIEPELLRERLAAGLRDPLRRTGGRGDDALLADLEIDEDEDARLVQARIDKRLWPLFEDVLALPARILKQRFWDLPPGPDRTRCGDEALAAYERAYTASKRVYAAINAASLALMTNKSERTTELAELVIKLTAGGQNYWSMASRGEALALLGRWQEAATVLAAAAACADATIGTVASTRRQMRLLDEFLGPEIQPALQALRQPGVASLTGHMMPTSVLEGPAQERRAHELAPRIAEAMERHDIRIAYGAVAGGSDILLAEAVLDRKGAFHVVLPFRVEDFNALSVQPCMAPEGSGPDWSARYSQVLARASSLVIASPERLDTTPKADIDDIIHHASRRATGLALLKADEVEGKAVLVAVYDGAEPQSVAGVAQLVSDCRATGLDVDVIDCGWRKGAANLPKRSLEAMKLDSIHRAIVFYWLSLAEDAGGLKKKDEARIDTLLESVRIFLGKGIAGAADLQRRVLRQSSIGLYGCFSTVTEALDAANAAACLPQHEEFRLRIVCDFGPLARRDGSISESRLGRLEGADMVTDLPDGIVVATTAFAAEARLSLGEVGRFQLMGRLAPGGDEGRRLPLPSITLYRVLRCGGR